MEHKLYKLIGKDGQVYKQVLTSSFTKARQYFYNEYCGNFIILCGDLRKNVRL